MGMIMDYHNPRSPYENHTMVNLTSQLDHGMETPWSFTENELNMVGFQMFSISLLAFKNILRKWTIYINLLGILGKP